jgi:LacI family transcriptional regulator
VTEASTRRARIKDVAELASVSVGTVSRVLNEHPDVSDQARARVRNAIAQLGYQPSSVGRALSKRSTSAIGILIPDMADPIFMMVAEGIEAVARQYDYAVMLSNSQRMLPGELQFADVMAGFAVSGVVIIGGSGEQDGELAARLGSIPVTVAFRRWRAGDAPVVTIDHYAAARMSVGHLVELGHRRIGSVRGDWASDAGKERQRGYQDALHAVGVDIGESLTVGRSFELSKSMASVTALLTRPDPPTAIFFASDQMAMGGLHVIKSHGFRVPQDISVASVNDIPFAAVADPPLTTVSMPAREMGMLATQSLLQLIEGKTPPATIVLSPELVVRKSAGPPP